jgi:Na+/H+ antiporter NhaC
MHLPGSAHLSLSLALVAGGPEALASAPFQEAAAVEVEAPRVALRGVGFEVRVAFADNVPLGARSDVRYRLTDAAGRELASGQVPPIEPAVIREVELTSRDQLPLQLAVESPDGGVVHTIRPSLYPGWISVLPPLIAIALALIFREVVISLFLGVWLGAFFFAGLDPLRGTWRAIDHFIVPALADPDHAAILIFSLMLGGMVGVMGRSGGTRGIVEAVRPLATTPRRAQLATYLGGLAIFFDDYANTLIVGNTFRPITDRLRVSREKLAYIVDSTAAPVAAIVFVSTWVGFEISLIGDGLRIAAAQTGANPELAAALDGASPFLVFIQSIPYLFYPILALLTVGLIIATQRDFGPMWAAENRASRGEGLYRDGAALMVDTASGGMDAKPGSPHRWQNAAFPVLTVIVVVLLGLYFDGRAAMGDSGSLREVLGAANAFNALLWGSLAGVIVAIVLAVGQRILDVREAIEGWLAGMRAMMMAFVILVLAWSLGEVTTELGTAPYLTGILEGTLSPNLLPALVFVTASMIAFATGTSWATMSILVPLVIPLIVALGGAAGLESGETPILLVGTISSVLAGAIFGDHCSPISDTTVLSSMASACDHMDHVRTQLPYALVVALIGLLVGDLPTAYGMHPAFSYLLGGVIILLLLRYVGRRDLDSPQWNTGEEETEVAGPADPGVGG